MKDAEGGKLPPKWEVSLLIVVSVRKAGSLLQTSRGKALSALRGPHLKLGSRWRGLVGL